ncbi:MAG: 50S ribosomal protein L17 [Candidatus Levyibacteriota bacterium]|jgi:large subunit ribosomal protein L17
MKKNVYGRKLSRDKNERKALFTSLMSALVMKERIITTEAKAKAIRADVEKLVTKAKQGSNAAKLVLQQSLSKDAFEKMLNNIAPRFTQKQGGYVRLIKAGKRFGDDAPVVVMEWTEVASAIVPVQTAKKVKAVKPVKKAPVKKTTKKVVVKKAK